MNPRWSAALFGVAVAVAGAAWAVEEAPALEQAPAFGKEQLDEMVAPVALYPDPLLMQVLMASTYPLEVVEADRWRRQQASLKGDALDQALEAKDWDPSVKGLTHFPDLLKRMSENLDWTKDLGDAFLDQKDDVLDAVQRMRAKAEAAGALKTTKEQTVAKEVVNNKETVVIQPADPEVVYVPQYAPQAVYGPTYVAPPAPYYPSVWAYPATTALLSFGVGVGVGALISNGCDWGRHDVYVNNNYYGGGGGGGKKNANVNVNKNVNRTWQHNSEHRRNVNYRDQRTGQRYEGRDKVASRDRARRDQSRGFDRGSGAGANRPDRGGAGGNRPGGGGVNRPGGGRDRPGAGGGMNRPGGERPGGGGRPATRPASGGREAFGGVGNGGATRQASQRGAASRGGQSWAGGGQRSGGGSGAARGGGGGGRGGGGRSGGGRRGGGGRRR